ncbi:MAG: histidine phosphatase family protein [Patescibacteria group bacterium]
MKEYWPPEKEKSKEEYSSRVLLHFFRHGEKEVNSGKPDEKIGLTHLGKKQAVEKSESKDLDQSVAFGSSRERAQETAGFVMGGSLDEITGEENLEELKLKLNKDQVFGSKIGADLLLDFSVEEDSAFGEKVAEAFKKGRFLTFLIKESDDLAKELMDKKSTTYSRAAANIARIIEKYLKIAPRWEAIIEDSEKEHKNTLERFLVTHQGNAESFLAKVMEFTKGVEERDKFVDILGGKGFGYVEGVNIEILNHLHDEPTIKISYRNNKNLKDPFIFEENIDFELLEKIIKGA